jgi:GrpB-like predicted nucleotidyltransferase (UPF0157 family)
MKVVIEEYNPMWPALFENEKELLSNVFDRTAFIIEHIGSTSIVGLGAKPVVDIMVGVADFTMANSFVAGIELQGYQYISSYESVMPFRKFFIKESAGIRTHHIHLVELNTDFWKRHLAFRDYLRENDKVRDAYFMLKKGLAEKEWNCGDEYAAAKADFINEVLNKAMK